MTCPICGHEIEGVGRLLYGLSLANASYVLNEAEHVCTRCYLALSPQEAAAHRALALVDLEEAR